MVEKSATPGMLYVVATPIGNRAELSPRAHKILATVDLIAAEDTRHSGALLRTFEVHTPQVSLHEHNETRRIDSLIARLVAGESIALISDAGTPGISDPGFELVRAARRSGIDVRPVSGPCAAIVALSVAGLPTDRFVFEGFLPAKSTARRRRLAELAEETRTLIVFEAGRRMSAMLADCRSVMGEARDVSIARELTKRFEESLQTDLAKAEDWLASDTNRSRGEFVVCIAGADTPASQRFSVELDTLLIELLAIAGTRQAAQIAARTLGVGRNLAYQRALTLGRDSGD